jgi:hypothetical protein
MKWISTKGISSETAPEGAVLVKYLEPRFGHWMKCYAVAYYDNPKDYINEEDAGGWIHDATGNFINVIAYCVLPDIEDKSIFEGMDQKQTKKKYGCTRPFLGCVGV